MKKIIIKFTLFMLIFFILLLILSRIFIPKNNSDESGMNNIHAMKILGEKENTIDVIMYGDSESFASTIPMKLWKEYGYTSFVCGTSGQTLPDTCRIAYDTLKKQNPKIVILEADTIFSPTEISVPIARVLYNILPITEYHNRWKTLTKNDFFGKIEYTETDANKGYYYLPQVDPAEDIDYMSYSEEIEPIPKLNKFFVKLLKKYCESKGAYFAIISVPNFKHWNYKKHNSAEAFANKENIEFIDLNVPNEDVKIDWKTETADKGDHVNYSGAKKVTSYIGKWLKSKNILENHKEDENYQKWNEDIKLVADGD